METPDLMMLLRLVRHRGWIDEDRLESWIAEFPGGLTVEGVFGRLVAAGTINSAEADAALTHLRNRARGLRDSSRERLQRGAAHVHVVVVERDDLDEPVPLHVVNVQSAG